MAVESTEVSRERLDPVDMLLGTRPMIRRLRLRGSGAEWRGAVFALARRAEMAVVSPCDSS